MNLYFRKYFVDCWQKYHFSVPLLSQVQLLYSKFKIIFLNHKKLFVFTYFGNCSAIFVLFLLHIFLGFDIINLKSFKSSNTF